MLFNSIAFLVFLPTVFFIYWGLFKNNLKGQNIFLLLASYTFYGWWDYRFLTLIIASTAVDYFVGLSLSKVKKQKKRKSLLLVSLIFNLGLLAVFKYYNFFIQSWQDAWNQIGIVSNISTLDIILPVGISFYTFQTLSYTIDIYKGRLQPTSNFIKFAVFVSFFPQLVAGPIERASHLLPQFSQKKHFQLDFAKSGINLIIWGLSKKVVIADTCAIYADTIFENHYRLNSATLILGAIYFAFQIYADFSGYTDMAIGISRLFGFRLMKNFNYPYFSRNMGEFWRRWHISLSTWFRDYLYIPLGGSRGTKIKIVRNIFIIFLISGFWHGANWTFLFWGGLHSIFFIPLLIQKRNRVYTNDIAEGKIVPSVKEISQMITTFFLSTFAWIFFRSENISTAFQYLRRLFINNDFTIQYLPIERYNIEILILLIAFISIEWMHRMEEHPFHGSWKDIKLLVILIMIFTLGVYSDYKEFLYFQF